MPTNRIHGHALFKPHAGKLEEFKRLSQKCMELSRTKDTGTLRYEVYISEDGSTCVVYEEYEDSAALMAHMKNLGETGQAVLATGDVSGELWGNPSDELAKQLKGGPVKVYRPFLSR
ncbi:MAG: putative quinol monooxygenase [Polyangiaceae bacterium]